jgi:hypothetical protein
VFVSPICAMLLCIYILYTVFTRSSTLSTPYKAYWKTQLTLARPQSLTVELTAFSSTQLAHLLRSYCPCSITIVIKALHTTHLTAVHRSHPPFTFRGANIDAWNVYITHIPLRHRPINLPYLPLDTAGHIHPWPRAERDAPRFGADDLCLCSNRF